MRSSYKRTERPSCVVSTTFGKYRSRITSRDASVSLSMIGSSSAPLRVPVGVADRPDVEPQHHRVILVNRVVAMHRVLPVEVAELYENRRLGIGLHAEDVLAPDRHEPGRRGRAAVDRENLELLEVDVDRMLPL